MKRFAVVLLMACAVVAIVGCGKKAAQTTPVQVSGPADKQAKPAEVAHPPSPAPTPPPAAPVPKPTPGKKGFVTAKSGLKYHDKMVGHGAETKAGETVTVHYKGWLDNGKVFDSSRSHGEPFSFTLGQGQVIRGWDEGVAGMRVGGVRELIIPPSLGYGDEDKGTIPPNSTLHFEIELLKVGE